MDDYATQTPGRRVRLCVFFGSVYCVIVCLSSALYNIFHTPMARYSRAVLKVPPTNQPTNYGNNQLKATGFKVLTYKAAVYASETFVQR